MLTWGISCDVPLFQVDKSDEDKRFSRIRIKTTGYLIYHHI
jgi:hypothetical protein